WRTSARWRMRFSARRGRSDGKDNAVLRTDAAHRQPKRKKMAKKRLGIDALFQTSVPNAVPPPPPTYGESPSATDDIAVDRLVPGPGQPRVHFDDRALGELTASIRAHGVLQPILVRPAGASFEIVAGERRWRAARAAGLERVPVHVVD